MSKLTVKYNKFLADAGTCTWPRHNSARLDAVLRALDKYERSPNWVTVMDLQYALRTWHRTDPKEFANRNTNSNGLCVKLMKEVGLYPEHPVSKELDLAAYEIYGPSDAVLRTDRDSFTRQACGVPTLMAQVKSKYHARVGVMLIDMQKGSSDYDRGFDVLYNSKTIVENQIDVLEAAKNLNLPVFNINSPGINAEPKVRPESVQDTLTLDLLKAHLSDDTMRLIHLMKVNNNTIQNTTRESERFPAQKFEEIFSETMGSPRGSWMVVMGWDANVCVKSTIFGGAALVGGDGIVRVPRKPGLLDLGYTVITARNLVASNFSPLEPAWGPVLEGM